jgi:XTP/dITP diphosphohydrolase
LHSREEILHAFSRLLDVQDELREKCPWDHKQTNESLRPHTIEEAFELCDAIMDGDVEEMQKELGDVMEHLVFYAMIGREKGLFDMGDVLTKEADKLIFRHPHIYGYVNEKGEHVKPICNTPEEVSSLWERVKQIERRKNAANGKTDANEVKGVLSGVPRSLPSLIKAYRIQDKARMVGFDWEQREDVWNKVFEEIDELKEELANGETEKAEQELGDVLFAIVNAARLYKINPDNALEHTNRKFISRFEYIERKAREMNKDIKDMTLGEMDMYWEEAKNEE